MVITKILQSAVCPVKKEKKIKIAVKLEIKAQCPSLRIKLFSFKIDHPCFRDDLTVLEMATCDYRTERYINS